MNYAKSSRSLGWIGAIVLLATLIALPRIFALDTYQTADEKRWLTNVGRFTDRLAHGEWDNLFQQPHPGITTQWFAASTVFVDSWQARKLPLVASQIVLTLLTGYVMLRLWNPIGAALGTAALAVNPLLVAHTRVYAMDSLLAHFLLLWLLLLLLWHKTGARQYIQFSGAAGALAILSKLPGIICIPITIALMAYTWWSERASSKDDRKRVLRSGLHWIIAFTITAILVLPSLVTNFQGVLGDIANFFSTADYTELHQRGFWFYTASLPFFTAPLHLALMVIVPFAWRWLSAQKRRDVLVLLAAALLFILMMSLGDKKGYRYALPALLFLDATLAVAAAALWGERKKRLIAYGLIVLMLWQGVILWQLHPYYLAYVNPIVKPWFGQHRLGWGEGLDRAAAYLNQKPNAENLTVASYYSSEFDAYFQGNTTDLNKWDNGHADYAVLYRAQFERGKTAWETDVLNQFAAREAEHVIVLNGLEYAWIYALESE